MGQFSAPPVWAVASSSLSLVHEAQDAPGVQGQLKSWIQRAARVDLTLLRRRPRTGPRCEARGCRSQADASVSNSLLLGLPVRGAASLALLTQRRMRASIASGNGDLRAAAPSPRRAAVNPCPDSVQLGQNSPSHQNPPATYESLHVNARARMPYLRAVRPPAHRISASPRTRAQLLTGTQRIAVHAVSKAFIPTARG